MDCPRDADDNGMPADTFKHISRAAALIYAASFCLTLPGCNTINGLVDGFERDVDGFAARMDTWSDQLLPTGGVGPQKYEPTHVDLKPPPRPSRYAGHTRFGKPHQ